MKSATLVQIGTLAQHAREEAGLSQAEIAEQVGVSLAWIGRVERGEASASYFRLSKLMEVLGYRFALLPVDWEQAEETGEGREVERLANVVVERVVAKLQAAL